MVGLLNSILDILFKMIDILNSNIKNNKMKLKGNQKNGRKDKRNIGRAIGFGFR